jgi:hypothetical protein
MCATPGYTGKGEKTIPFFNRLIGLTSFNTITMAESSIVNKWVEGFVFSTMAKVY